MVLLRYIKSLNMIEKILVHTVSNYDFKRRVCFKHYLRNKICVQLLSNVHFTVCTYVLMYGCVS